MLTSLLVLVSIGTSFSRDFCQIDSIDFVFNHRGEVILTKDNSYWSFDLITRQILNVNDSKQSEDFGYPKMSCISITTVPNCSVIDICEDFVKLQNMSFSIIYYNGYQFLSEKNINGIAVKNPKDMPWNISSDGFDIWPHTLSNDLWFIGVYWPTKYEIIFLINNGDLMTSAIVYNSIAQKHWWKHLRHSPLKTSVMFDGLFLIDNSIYAIGDGKDVFKLIVDDEKRFLQKIVNSNKIFNLICNDNSKAKNATEFFGCDCSERNCMLSSMEIHVNSYQLINQQSIDLLDKWNSSTSAQPNRPSIIFYLTLVIGLLALLLSILLLTVILFRCYSSKRAQKEFSKKNKMAIDRHKGYLPQGPSETQEGTISFKIQNLTDRQDIHEPMIIESRTGLSNTVPVNVHFLKASESDSIETE